MFDLRIDTKTKAEVLYLALFDYAQTRKITMTDDAKKAHKELEDELAEIIVKWSKIYGSN